MTRLNREELSSNFKLMKETVLDFMTPMSRQYLSLPCYMDVYSASRENYADELFDDTKMLDTVNLQVVAMLADDLKDKIRLSSIFTTGINGAPNTMILAAILLHNSEDRGYRRIAGDIMNIAIDEVMSSPTDSPDGACLLLLALYTNIIKDINMNNKGLILEFNTPMSNRDRSMLDQYVRNEGYALGVESNTLIEILDGKFASKGYYGHRYMAEYLVLILHSNLRSFVDVGDIVSELITYEV